VTVRRCMPNCLARSLTGTCCSYFLINFVISVMLRRCCADAGDALALQVAWALRLHSAPNAGGSRPPRGLSRVAQAPLTISADQAPIPIDVISALCLVLVNAGAELGSSLAARWALKRSSIAFSPRSNTG